MIIDLVTLLAAVGLGAAAPLDLDCRERTEALALIGRARAFEILHLENDHWQLLQEALGRCRTTPDRPGCEDERRAESERALARARAAIEKKYRRMTEELEVRCRAPLAARALVI